MMSSLGNFMGPRGITGSYLSDYYPQFMQQFGNVMPYGGYNYMDPIYGGSMYGLMSPYGSYGRGGFFGGLTDPGGKGGKMQAGNNQGLFMPYPYSPYGPQTGGGYGGQFQMPVYHATQPAQSAPQQTKQPAQQQAPEQAPKMTDKEKRRKWIIDQMSRGGDK